MSPNLPNVPNSVLVEFAQTNSDAKKEIEDLGLTAEEAVTFDAVRSLLLVIHERAMAKEKAARRAEEEAAEAARRAEEAARKQHVESRAAARLDALLGITPEQKLQQAIEAWVLAFGKGETKDIPAPNTDETGKIHFCAAPVKCCNKKKPVYTGAIVNGQVYGICPTMVVAFKEMGQKIGRTDRLFYMNISKAIDELEARNRAQLVNAEVEALAYDSPKEPPEHRTDEAGKIVCGLHGPCCDRKQPAMRFAVYQGVRYGLCDYANGVYWNWFHKTGRRITHLKSTTNYSVLEGIAARQQREIELRNANQQREIELCNLVDSIVSCTIEEPPTMEYGEDRRSPVCAFHRYGICCDGTREANKFASYRGNVYAICNKVAVAFIAGLERHGDLACLKFTNNDLKQAEYFAAQWRLANPTPVSDKGSAGTKSRKAKQLAKKQARSAAVLAATPKPNNGSGDIAAQSMGKGNGGDKPGKGGGKRK